MKILYHHKLYETSPSQSDGSCSYVLATNNPGKVKEIAPYFKDAGIELIGLADLGLRFEAQETTGTFEGNAKQKAHETLAFLKSQGHNNFAVLSDDSGLMIDAMNGQPGVESANFLGRETPYEKRFDVILNALGGLNGAARAARFVCVMVCAFPDGREIVTSGTMEGEIAQESYGAGGFGYDPIFYVPELSKTTAQMTKDEKNAISHRGKALAEMIRLLENKKT